jgi:hypothetical protein
MAATVDIVLSTFNGEAFLGDQMTSLLRQTHSDWRLVARDDASTDGTASAVAVFVRQAAGGSLLLPGRTRVGPYQSFGLALAQSSGDYAMFCDQDDVWLSDKVEKTLDLMRGMEARMGCDVPLLVHTDMKVTDRNLRVLSDSFVEYAGLRPQRGTSLARALVQNCVSGCTVMMNRALRELALPVPLEAVMHDHWVALVASAFGAVGFLGDATLLHRVHPRSRIGASRIGLPRPNCASGVFGRLLAGLRDKQGQARAFLARYGARLSPAHRVVVEDFAALGRRALFRSAGSVIRHGFLPARPFRALRLAAQAVLEHAGRGRARGQWA